MWHGLRSIAKLVSPRSVSLLPLACLAGLLSFGAACSPSLSTLQPARTTPAGHLQITTSAEYVHTEGQIREAIGIVENADFGGRMTAAEVTEIIDAATVALVQPPSVGGQLSAAYGLTQRFELGAKVSGSAIRGHLRFQWLRISPGIYGSLGFGVSGYLFGFPLHTVSEDAVKVDGFSRWDFDVPLHLGYSNRYFHIWGGPKLIFTTFNAGVTLCTDTRSATCGSTAAVSIGGTAAYVTGQFGLAVGYKRFWVAAELTVGRVGTSGNVDVVQGARTEEGVFAHEGLVVSPSVGVIAWF